MHNLQNYQFVEKIHERLSTIVYRAQRAIDQNPVILKTFSIEHPPLKELARLKHEYTLLKKLEGRGIIKAYALEKWKNRLILVLEDIGGDSLELILNSTPMAWKEVVKIAIQIAEILSAVHEQHIIHKDINPSNIILHQETQRVQLIDFGIASALSRETQEVETPNRLEGSLPYISPEQTGRMNRSIDYRTDFYSLGVTLYQMLTGRLPFQSESMMELVYLHIAKFPPSPYELNPDVPRELSAVVMKCLEKTAEERYQSAFGLKVDLEECFELGEASTVSEFFVPGQIDVSNRFQISQKLYGREKEITKLMAAFERVSQGATEMMIISGYSGIGKTSLVYDIHKPVVRNRGYFISGKFDQMKRNIPYSSLIQAFKELIRQLLSEGEERVAIWKEKLLKALGPNGAVITEIIPEIEWIIGKQPPVPDLPPAESQNRFNLVFQFFVQTFAAPEQPLVLFLDDLQWANLSSLELIEHLMMDSNTGHLLIIGAYRDNEMDASHPLMLKLEAIHKAQISINRMTLNPLALSHITQLIVDTLQCPEEQAVSLAELCLNKTQGNPFFLNQFLMALYERKLLQFDGIRGKWQWDLEQIQTVEITNNVADLMVSKIRKLSEVSQNVLKLAACIGNRFDLKTLSIINEASHLITSDALWEAIEEGLVEPIGNNYQLVYDLENTVEVKERTPLPQNNAWLSEKIDYKFLHDRVQQAAYSLIAEDYKKEVHLKIGRRLLESISPEEKEESLFSLVNHLNLGRRQINDLPEREELARLNLVAGKKAKASAAYETAFHYLKTGLSLLKRDCWQTQYHLTLAIHEEAAEAAQLSTHFEEMERLVESVLNEAQTVLERVKVYQIKIQAYMARNQLRDAVQTMLQILKLLGVRWPIQPSLFQIGLQFLQTRVALIGKRPETLLALPEMTNPHTLAILRILADGGPASLFASPKLVPLICCKSLLLSLKYGISPQISPMAYASYGMFLCGILGDMEKGDQFGQLAIKLMERSKVKESIAKTQVVTQVFITHWNKHAREVLSPLLIAYQHALESGDVEFAGHASYAYTAYSFLSGRELEELEPEIRKYDYVFRKFKLQSTFGLQQMYHQTVLNLMGKTELPCQLIGESYDEEKMFPIHLEADHQMQLFMLHLNKLILYYLFQFPQKALEQANEAKKYFDSVFGTLMLSSFQFYDSLVRLALFPEVSGSQQKKFLRQIARNQKKLKKWACHAPMNYLHKWMLVAAEYNRIIDKPHLAGDYYEQAIQLAREHEYLHEEALAYELAAKFYLTQNKPLVARTYMTEAHYVYQRWGAVTKLKDLEERHSDLIVQHPGNTWTKGARTLSETMNFPLSTGTIRSMSLDLASVKKASQTLSGEMILSDLLENLLKIVIENAGAQKGAIVVEKEGQLVIEGQGGIDQETIMVLQSIPVRSEDSPEATTLPLTILQYVYHTQEEVLLNDALHEERFLADPYFIRNQPQSILCLPILHQGVLTSMLYLENQLTTDAFPPHRLEVLKLISSQVAISIENADLYSHLAQGESLEQKLFLSQRRVSAILDITDEAIIAVNEMEEIVFFNRSVEQLLGYSAQEMLGQSLSILFPPHERQTDHAFFTKLGHILLDLYIDDNPPIDPVIGTSLSQSDHSESSEEYHPVVFLCKDGSDFFGEALITSLELEEEMLVILLRKAKSQVPDHEAIPMASTPEFIEELNRNRNRVQKLGTIMDGLTPSLLKNNETLLQELKSIDMALEHLSQSLGEQESPDEFRHTLVDVMLKSLACWEQATQKDKVELAEESGIWSVHLDKSQMRARAMERYLSLKKLPKNPRWREVVRTAYYVLSDTSPDPALKQSLEVALNQLLKLVHQRSLS